jgi:CSLREA domain-containing protein
VRERLSIWVIAVAWAAVCHVAPAAAFTVNSQADEVDAKPGDGSCATAGGACTLRAAIQEANEQGGATINLGPGTYTLTIKPTGGLPDISNGDLDLYGELTISGADAKTTIVDGGGLDRVFSAQVASRVTISDVTVRNGAAQQGEDGGGIDNYGNLTLEDVIVSGNRTQSDATLSADAPGGGIYNAATLAVRNCTITGNSAADMGGGIHNKGILTVMMSTIAENTAKTDRGGGLSNFNTATVILTTVSGNTATGAGGGVENGGKLVLTHATVSGNTGEHGGGIHTVGDLHMTDSTVAGNTARKSGGGIANERSSDALKGAAKLNGATIAGNKGGGVSSGTSAKMLLANTIVAANSGGDCAGTIVSAGYNLIQSTTGCDIGGRQEANVTGKDAKLGPLANNGGPTQTMALLAGSPAIDAGNPAPPGSGKGACESTDQRGTKRPVDGAGKAVCDIGAYELTR